MEFKTQDGWTLLGKYLEAKPGQQTFVLLHGRGQNKESWVRLARSLSKDGFGYLGLDLRGHGQSGIGPDGGPAPWRKFKATKTENDWANMTLDIQAAVDYLLTEGLSEDSMGLIGADVGGSVGLKYAAVHPKVPLLILLSPGMSYQEVLTVNAIRAYKDRPILLVYSELDRTAAKATPILYEFAKRAAGEKNATMLSAGKRPPGRLLHSAIIRQIVEWIINPVRMDPPQAGEGPPTSPEVPEEPLSPEE